MKWFSLIAVAVLMVCPAAGAERTVDITGWVSLIEPNSEGTFASDPENILDVNVGGEMGYGAAVNIFWGRASFELSVSRVKSTVSLEGTDINVPDADVEMIPITGILQWHFRPDSLLDPYLGVGGMYTTFGDVDTADATGAIRLSEIDADDLGLVLNGGFGIALSEGLGLVLDVKYVPTGSAGRAVLVDGTETDLEISPVIFSAGLSLRF